MRLLEQYVIPYIIPTIAGLIFVYAPFVWCRFTGERPEDYGLTWQTDRRRVAETLLVSALFLTPLTMLAVNWPMEQLPRHSDLLRTAELASSGVAAAIIEEIFFRGWIHPLFRKKLPAFFAITFTATLFALAHIFVAQTPFLFAVFFPGCVMGWLRERHGNIASSTIFHALGNLWAIWCAPLEWPSLDWARVQMELLLQNY